MEVANYINTYFIGTRKYVLRMNMIIPDFTAIVYVRQVWRDWCLSRVRTLLRLEHYCDFSKHDPKVYRNDAFVEVLVSIASSAARIYIILYSIQITHRALELRTYYISDKHQNLSDWEKADLVRFWYLHKLLTWRYKDLVCIHRMHVSIYKQYCKQWLLSSS